MKTPCLLTAIHAKTSLLALLLAAPILTAPLASAFSGGNSSPLSNGTFFPNEGTFQAAIRGVNLSGVATFSTGPTSSNSTSSGSFAVTYQGQSYTGNVDANLDSASGNIAATMEASIARGGNGTASTIVDSAYQATGNYTTIDGGTSVMLVPEVVTTTLSGGTTNISSPVVTTLTLNGPQSLANDANGNGHILNSAQTSQTVTNSANVETQLPDTALVSTNMVGVTSDLPDSVAANYGWVDEVADSTYRDTLYASGSFTAKLNNSFPNQIFKGKGTMQFTAINFTLVPPALETTTVAITVKGSRIANTAQGYTDQTVQAPSILTTISLQNRTN